MGTRAGPKGAPDVPEKNRDATRRGKIRAQTGRLRPRALARTIARPKTSPENTRARPKGRRVCCGCRKTTMAKKMLIDATHAEETRVVVVDGNKVEEFDFESENKRQLAGNIYLAKVTRVEPSLQAAFVDYGGNRHGFLAFSEIHPDYYQIPVADREALMAEELAYAKAQEEEEDKPKRPRRRSRSRTRTKAEELSSSDAVETQEVAGEQADQDSATQDSATEENVKEDSAPQSISGMDVIEPEASEADDMIADPSEHSPVEEGTSPAFAVQDTPVEEPADDAETASDDSSDDQGDSDDDEGDDEDDAETAADKDDSIESVADDDTSDDFRPVRKPRPRKYKIQEVVKVRQVLLVQVVKEERGNKGAALTTYLSLAGRYCVLMPNTARGGGISRKITNIADRKKLKEIAGELEVPQGAGLIVRTAGAQRTKTEIKRDYDYLKRMWEQIRALTLKSTAPAKIYEEGDLIKRSIRDLYNKDIDEVFVEGEAGFREAKAFMEMIMPTHAENVKHYSDSLPLFARFQVESYLSSMFNPTVQLKSGGYIVIDLTEALVAVDVNSGRATKEGSIEETALKTNLEAAEEVARQARLRDLAGLIVIDFIDMEERRNNAAVEKRLKDKLKTDRARIQVGRISGFGLLEMSRQRLRPGMLEATTQPCPHCHGTGLIRSDDNMALTILRQLEEEGTRKRSREVLVKAPVAVINYLVNIKRERVAQIEARYGMAVRLEADPFMISPDFTIERFKTATRVIVAEQSNVISASADMMADYVEPEEEPVDAVVEEAAAVEVSEPRSVDATEDTGEEEKPKKRRRRRRRRRKPGDAPEGQEGENGSDEDAGSDDDTASEDGESTPAEASSDAPEAAEDAPVEKPKRTRTRSRSSKKTSPVSEEVTETKDEAKEEGAPEAVAEAVAPAAEDAPVEKPKRTRTSRARKPAGVAEEGAEPAAETETVAKPKTTRSRAKKPVTEGEGEAAVAKPKPAPRKRKTKAQREAEEAAKAAEAAAVEASAPAVTETPAEAPVETVQVEAVQVEAAQVEAVPEVAAEVVPETVAEVAVEAPVVETVAEPVAEAASEPAPAPTTELAEASSGTETASEPEDEGPKRRGWWSIGR